MCYGVVNGGVMVLLMVVLMVLQDVKVVAVSLAVVVVVVYGLLFLWLFGEPKNINEQPFPPS